MPSTIERFSNRVENYIKYRPDYPREIIGYLRARGVLLDKAVVADIGCGTGISTRMWLEAGSRVIGVEPNAKMREAAARFLVDFENLQLVDGTSTSTGLPERSVDIVTAAQAFHWFEPDGTRKEFQRILRPGGSVVLIWNLRRSDLTPFLQEYEQFLLRYATDYINVRHENVTDADIEAVFGPEIEKTVFPNEQVLDFDGLKGRLLSSSYVPDESTEIYPQMIADLRLLFAKHERDGRISIFYDTCVYHARLFDV